MTASELRVARMVVLELMGEIALERAHREDDERPLAVLSEAWILAGFPDWSTLVDCLPYQPLSRRERLELVERARKGRPKRILRADARGARGAREALKRATAFLDSASWLTVHDDEHEGETCVRVELHHPRRETSVGWVDRPKIARGSTVERALRRLVRDHELDPERILAKLSQLDVFGGATPIDELELPAVLRLLAESERALERPLTDDEAGAILHHRRGRHTLDGRCAYCTIDGREALERLRKRRPLDPAGTGADETSSRLADTPARLDRAGLRPGPATARSTDPATSHAAAASISGSALRASQIAVLCLFQREGPMTDVALVDRYLELVDDGVVVAQVASGIRTRRHELEELGLVRDSGRKERLDTGRMAVVWEIAESLNEPSLDSAAAAGYDPEPAL